MNVFADDNIVLLKEVLESYCNLMLFSGRLLNCNDLIEANCEVLFTRSQTKVNHDLLGNTNVKIVATATSGTDHFDIDYLDQNNIKYYSANGSNANSVAEYVIYSILKWTYANNIDINESTIGIVGFGSIGKLVAYYSSLMGLNVIVNDPPLRDINYDFPDYVEYFEIDELISKCNILTNHVPLNIGGNYNTFQLFNNDNLKSFREDGLLIHSSRGAVICESALHYLADTMNVTLAIDVWENEPDFDIELAKKAMLATPHIAGHSHNGKLNGTIRILEVFEEYCKICVDKSLIFKELSTNDTYDIYDFLTRKELMELLSSNRNFESDHFEFLQLLELSKEDKAIKFDHLRKHYPIRYESLRGRI